MGPETEPAIYSAKSIDPRDLAFYLRRFGPILACALFIGLGAAFLPLAGIQSDEALFATPYYSHEFVWAGASLLGKIRHMAVPLMVMSYLGALKMYVYLPILKLFGANLWSIRLPVVLAGGLTVFLFHRLTYAALGAQVALLATFILATDPTFLLTATFDWGPVAIEHLLLVSACLLILQFGSYSEGGAEGRAQNDGPPWKLIAGFGCFGLAMWNKAIFSWALAGLAVASLLVLGKYWIRVLSIRNLAWAVAGLLAGASPLIVYNLTHSLATFRENTHFETSGPGAKWIQVQSGANGSSLFGYLAQEEHAPQPKDAQGVLARASVAIRDNLGPQRSTGFYYELGALLVLGAPWWWRSRTAWFSLIFCSVAWLLMALTVGAGASAHHVVLLWPFPILFAAAALKALSLPTRWFGWILLVAGVPVVLMNLVVLNQYYSQFVRFGAGDVFTDAMTGLSAALPRSSSDTIDIIDWGMYDSLNVLHRGGLKLNMASGPLMNDKRSEDEQRDVMAMLNDPTALFVAHMKDKEAFANVGEHLDAVASDAGYHRTDVQVILDSNGRPVFQIFRMQK